MKNFRNELATLLVEHIEGLELSQIEYALEMPPTPDMGDYAFPCFSLAKVLRKAPPMIANDLKSKLDQEALPWIDRIEVKGAYLNFFLAPEALAEEMLLAVWKEGAKYGSTTQGEGQSIVVEYSSTNIAKPFHIGHIRSTVQGDVLASLYEFLGYDTVRINYLGDYGTQFGMLINAYRLWGSKEKIEANPIQELLELYVRYNKEAKEDEALMDQARDSFLALENDEPEAVEIWSWFKEISLKEFNRVYDMLNIRFDSYDGESYHSQFIPAVMEELEEKKLLKVDDGATIIDLGEDMPPAMVLKSNGSSTYLTRDIATALNRKRIYDFKENLYVVGTQQNLHFQQLRAVLKRMGYDWYESVEHVPFGMVSVADGALSTREGNVIFLEDVLNGAIEKTRKIMEDRNADIEDIDKIAKQVGIGAIKFQELYNNRIKDYVFDWDQILNFDGETGPYVQYSRARANRVVERAKTELAIEVTTDVDFKLLKLEEERQLARVLYDFPSVVQAAVAKKEPSMVTRHTVEIAKAFNKFYNRAPILNAEDEDLTKVRLLMTWATSSVIVTALDLLGIEAPERM